MNYRHAFHAGNHADCLKHALLVALLDHLRRKETPFFVLDTHAGPGLAALDGPEASRTAEWRDGIGRLAPDPPPALLAFLAALRDAGHDGRHYPGSPLIALARLRPADRLIAAELHPDDASSLRRALQPFPNAAAHGRDGYEAVRALLPLEGPHRRGLVLVDPPYESADDWDRAAGAVATARRRVAGAAVAVWYPLKGRAASRRFHALLADGGVRDLLLVELTLRDPTNRTRLDGSALVVAAPPFGFADDARPIVAALRDRLAPADGAFRVETLVDE